MEKMMFKKLYACELRTVKNNPWILGLPFIMLLLFAAMG